MATDATFNAFEMILQPLASTLPIEAAATVAAFELSPEVRERIEQLAERSTAGTLTPTERDEYSSLVTALDFVAIFQAQARRRAARA